MSEPSTITVDGNEAVARVAYRLSEVIAIYPITPASPMGEWADVWAGKGEPNMWGTVPAVVEMQSEAGAAGAVHGALQTGALATTFTASQGLLLMLPNMFKIAGELTPAVFHVAARSVATHALSIFCDHSDVMAARTTGFALLAAGDVQAAQDTALVSMAATLAGRVPVLHFFDGFRTSHEVTNIVPLDDADLRASIDEDLVLAHRARALDPDRPCVRGTAQNPDVFFQSREAANPFYAEFPSVVQRCFDRFAARSGRRYRLFEYAGHPAAERVVVAMGSGATTLRATVQRLVQQGEKVGCVEVRLYRPFDVVAFAAALPASVRAIAVLDRTKESGAPGEPLYLDVVAALAQVGRAIRVVGGRYGLGSKEFTPAMAKAVLDHLGGAAPAHSFTVGITDDVGHASLTVAADFDLDRDPDVARAMFFGLGADGTVGANKNTIKIVAERAGQHVQGFFVYDSKKAGAITVSHLRCGPRPIRAPYLIAPGTATFVACHHPSLLERHDLASSIAPGGTLLLNVPWPAASVFAQLPRALQHAIIEKRLSVFAIDAQRIARDALLGGRISAIMQACFFAVSGVLPRDEAIAEAKAAVAATYGKRGGDVVERNLRVVDQALAELKPVPIPAAPTAAQPSRQIVPATASPFVREVTALLLTGRGDELPVGALPVDGTFPSATSSFEKRGIAAELPIWEPDICIQCGRCALVCPHAAIRVKVFEPAQLAGAPAGFRSHSFLGQDHAGLATTIQVAPDDCTGCVLCVNVCPAVDKTQPRRKALNMRAAPPHVASERQNFAFFLALPELDRALVKRELVRESQIMQPLFEFSGACAGCGETPYLKLLSQLFGDRALIANATGCSSIYGGNLPTTPWAVNAQGRGPAWNNSLFEDAGEFGLGFRLTLDQQRHEAEAILRELAPLVGDDLLHDLLAPLSDDEAAIAAQRRRVEALRQRLARVDNPRARRLLSIAGVLVERSVWIVGGDGWAYDIGSGGLDHVLASGRNVNVLLLDTEVYSNTGGQMSKSTPRGAVAKFAAGGKSTAKKDLGAIAMAHGHVYVAQVAMGANDKQTVRAFLEAASYRGPSLIIAYSHCIAHGIDMAFGMDNQRAAVECGHWPLYRWDPRRLHDGHNPLQLDCKPPKTKFADFARRESRFHMLLRSQPDVAQRLLALTQQDIDERWSGLQQRAGMHYEPELLS